jgi:4-hydroxythreonine-4-phosphate dehydrogenase
VTERVEPPLVLTQGDPAGIGPELILKAWSERRETALPRFLVAADPAHLRRLSADLGWNVPIAEAGPEDVDTVFPLALPVLPLTRRVVSLPGRPLAEDAAGTIESIETAVALVRAGRAAAVVTNPIAKHVLYGAGFRHPGHTEFLAALAAAPGEEPPHPVMMLWSETMAVVPVTVHIPLARVPEALSTGLIVKTGLIVAHDLRTRFGLTAPRLALAGLNPHAGENGALGAEDATVIAPAVAALRANGILAEGPLPADTMFHARARRHYDVALAMYHDQALIPIKTIAFDHAVNVTLGLPFVRTSPDHGTAFDIAGKGIARPDSLIAAVRLAEQLGARALAP